MGVSDDRGRRCPCAAREEVRAGASSLRAAEWCEKSRNANKTADTRCFPGRAAKGANLAIRAKTETGNFTCLRFGFFYALFPVFGPDMWL